jgi:hypothetical protein
VYTGTFPAGLRVINIIFFIADKHMCSDHARDIGHSHCTDLSPLS